MQKNNNEMMIEEHDKAINPGPNDSVYHYNKGNELYDLYRYEKAIEEYDKAIELDPTNPDYQNNKRQCVQKIK